MNDNGYAMVYYVHDADGETVLFDKRSKQAFKHDPKIFKSWCIRFKRDCSNYVKKGRALPFHSNRFHASSNPVVATQKSYNKPVFTTDDNFHQNRLTFLTIEDIL